MECLLLSKHPSLWGIVLDFNMHNMLIQSEWLTLLAPLLLLYVGSFPGSSSFTKHKTAYWELQDTRVLSQSVMLNTGKLVAWTNPLSFMKTLQKSNKHILKGKLLNIPILDGKQDENVQYDNFLYFIPEFMASRIRQEKELKCVRVRSEEISIWRTYT